MVKLIWEEFLNILKEEAGSQIVETWFKAVSLIKWEPENKVALLKLPNQFVSNWIQEHYLLLIKTHLSRLLHTDNINISFICKNQPTGTSRNIIPASVIPEDSKSTDFSTKNQSQLKSTSLTIQKTKFPTKQKFKRSRGSLNSMYQFDSFIVGPSNSLAHAAAYAVCQNIGKVYNPLFIYGSTGLGKTHLLHAIGNEVLKKNNKLIVRYETTDHFMHEFITSIRFDKCHLFREKHQKVDLLLLDDVQFLSNKEQTQETFFHIFNILHQKQKQIILSSDTFPKEITGLQSRLKSRMEWGLIADIQTPDLETKIAILKKKAEEQSIKINDDIANLIASRVLSNIRELEGALVRVGAFAALTNQAITINLAQKVLLNLPQKKNANIQLETILKLVSKHYFVSVQDLRSKRRQQIIAVARQIAFYLMKKHTLASLQAIGNYIGGRDHSTVIHAITKVEASLGKNPELYLKIKALEQEMSTN